MRILYHHRTQGQGAEGVHIRGIIQALKELGHMVDAVSPPGSDFDEKRNPADRIFFQRWGRLWRFFSQQIPEVFFELLELTYNLYCYRKLQFKIRSFRPDLIYDRYALFNLSPVLLARRYHLKFVLEVNDATFIERSRPLHLKKIARLIEKKILNEAPFIVTISEYFKSLLISEHGIAPEKVIVLPNAIDPKRFDVCQNNNFRKNLGLEKSFVIGVVGAFVPWHGLDFFVESIVDFLSCKKEAIVLLVGDGPVRPYIEEKIHQKGLGESIRFTGFLPSSEIPAYLSCMDICIMPDSNEHGSPMKIFEYMAMGKPVLAPRYGPIEEVIAHGKNGWLFSPRDGKELCAAVELLAGDKSLRERLAGNAKRDVLSLHTWVIRVQALLSFISQSAR